MGKYKKTSKYNVVSMRVSVNEKAKIDEVTRATHMNISNIMREAVLLLYAPHLEMMSRNK